MRLALLLLLLYPTVWATSVKSLVCRVIKEEPGDPTPIRVVELKENNKEYVFSYTDNLEKTPLKAIYSNFKCQFFKVDRCGFDQLFDCNYRDISALPPGKLSTTVLVDCEGPGGISIKNYYIPEIEMTLLNQPGKHVSVIRERMRWFGTQLPGQRIFVDTFDVARAECSADLM